MRDKSVFITGAFDGLHAGHIAVLKYAASKGDSLSVAIDSDRKIRSEKGEGRPIHTADQRSSDLIFCHEVRVDVVYDFDSEEELIEILKKVKPRVRVVGSDWKGKEIVGAEHCKEIVYFDRIPGYSTTGMIENDRKD